MKENNLVTSETLQETVNLGDLIVGHTYHTRMPILQNDSKYPHKTPIQIVAEHSIVYGIRVYIGFLNEHRVLVTADDVY